MKLYILYAILMAQIMFVPAYADSKYDTGLEYLESILHHIDKIEAEIGQTVEHADELREIVQTLRGMPLVSISDVPISENIVDINVDLESLKISLDPAESVVEASFYAADLSANAADIAKSVMSAEYIIAHNTAYDTAYAAAIGHATTAIRDAEYDTGHITNHKAYDILNGVWYVAGAAGTYAVDVEFGGKNSIESIYADTIGPLANVPSAHVAAYAAAATAYATTAISDAEHVPHDLIAFSAQSAVTVAAFTESAIGVYSITDATAIVSKVYNSINSSSKNYTDIFDIVTIVYAGLWTFLILPDALDYSEQVKKYLVENSPVTKSGGGGCNDCTPPTIGLDSNSKRIVDNGFIYNDIPVQVELYHTPYPLVTSTVGESNKVEITTYENSGIQNIKWVQFGIGAPNISTPLHEFELLITIFLQNKWY